MCSPIPRWRWASSASSRPCRSCWPASTAAPWPTVWTAAVSWAYAVDAAAFLPAAALVWMLPPQPPTEPDAVARGWRAPAQAIGYVYRHRLVASLFSADLVAMIFGMPTALFPALALSV